MAEQQAVGRQDEVRAHFRAQAEACDALGSPFTAGLCRALAEMLDETTATGRGVLDWPGDTRDDALSLRLCGALNALVLGKRDAILAAAFPPRSAPQIILQAILPGVLMRHDQRLLAALNSPPQTNEIGRSAMLLPGYLAIARETGLPLDIHEIGASAGLNLMFDRFFYRYGEQQWGSPESPVQLAPELRGANPIPLEGSLDIRSRDATDHAPVDIADPAARLRLRSFIWPDQTARLERLDAALKLASAARLKVRRADAVEAVRALLANRKDGTIPVLVHSIMWQYMPDGTKAAIVDTILQALDPATNNRPLAWLRMEPLRTSDSFATLALTLWPGGATRHLARCDYHGRWIEWL